MRSFLAVGLIALALPAALSGAGTRSPYADSPCRTTRTTWANDACAGRQWGLTAIKAPQAWQTTRGSGVLLAVVDTGADFHHPDLRGQLVRRPGSNLLAITTFHCPFQRPAARAHSSVAVWT